MFETTARKSTNSWKTLRLKLNQTRSPRSGSLTLSTWTVFWWKELPWVLAQAWSLWLTPSTSKTKPSLTNNPFSTSRSCFKTVKSNSSPQSRAMKGEMVSETSSTTLSKTSFLCLFKCLVLIQDKETTWLKLKISLSFMEQPRRSASNWMKLRRLPRNSSSNILASLSSGPKNSKCLSKLSSKLEMTSETSLSKLLR